MRSITLSITGNTFTKPCFRRRLSCGRLMRVHPYRGQKIELYPLMGVVDGYRGLTNRIHIDYNQILMVYNKFANKILKTIRGLEKEMVADKGSKPIDSYRNRCLTLIEKLQEIYSGDDHSREKIECLKSAFDVYSNLQRKSDENAGTQDIARRELADTPRLRSSRGYASMNWNAIGWTKGGGSDRLRGYYGGPKIRGLKTPYNDDLSKTDYWCVIDDKRKK